MNTALNNKISLLLTVTPSSSAHLKTLEAEGLVGKFEVKIPLNELSDEAGNDTN